MRLPARLLLAFVGHVLVLAGCTHAPWHPFRGWRAWKEGNVVLYTDTLFEQQQALEWMVGASEILQATFFRHVRLPPVEVLYVQPGNDSRFIDGGGAQKFGVMIAQLPAPVRGARRPLVVVGRWEGPGPYAHLLIHHHIEVAVPGAPLWFHEGLASYLSLFHMPPERPGVVCFGFFNPTASWQVTVKLRELLAATWKDYNQESAPWIAPSAAALIDFLFHGEDGRWRSRHHLLMEELARGRSGEEALLRALPELTLDELDARYREHIRARKARGTCPMPVRLRPRAVLPPSQAVSPAVKQYVDEQQIRTLFESLENVPERHGFADYFPAAAEPPRPAR